MSSKRRGVSSRKRKPQTTRTKLESCGFCEACSVHYYQHVTLTRLTRQTMNAYRNSNVQYTCFVTLHFIRGFGVEDIGIGSSVGGRLRWSAGQLKQCNPKRRATPCHRPSRKDCNIACITWPGVWPAPEELIKPVRGRVAALKMYVLFTYPPLSPVEITE
jgi:hypothetical protein